MYVMWFEDRSSNSEGYTVALSSTPQGPFITRFVNVKMPGEGKIGDFNIFIDDDDVAYHVRTGLDIVRLDENFTAPTELVTSIQTPVRLEAPTLFKRRGLYYITAGTLCCACIGGANVEIYTSTSLSGNWTYRGDVGSNVNVTFNASSPNNYVTKAQGSATFVSCKDTIVWLGNQWNSGISSHGPRNHDLLYFSRLDFNEEDGSVKQISYQEDVDFEVCFE